MKTVNGVYASAKIFTDNVEAYALAQIQMLCDHAASEGSRIRVMPDVHPGKVGTIGLTMTVGEMALPNVTGIDIGCGITITKIKQKKIEYQKLDKVIRENVPSGAALRAKVHRFAEETGLERLRCCEHVNLDKAEASLGTLGGGNHFIEIDRDEEGGLYAAVHSGSRHLGKEVTEYYLAQGQKALKESGVKVPYELTYLTGELLEDYLYDQQIVQEFAEINRQAILDEIRKGMKWKMEESISCVHNYIEIPEEDSGAEPMLRKGAISAKDGERVVIPINMRDGMILGTGKGNRDWNESAPHGSGRILKRSEVKSRYTMAQFKTEMKGIYCTCIGKETLDEAPFAYRRLEEIAGNIAETVEIDKVIRPVYNYKDGSRR